MTLKIGWLHEAEQSLRTWLHEADEWQFAQWRVLYATDRLVREYEDVVGQMEIARELDINEPTASELLKRLSRAGLVDIAPECWRTLNGVLLSPRGEALLKETREAVCGELRELRELHELRELRELHESRELRELHELRRGEPVADGGRADSSPMSSAQAGCDGGVTGVTGCRIREGGDRKCGAGCRRPRRP